MKNVPFFHSSLLLVLILTSVCYAKKSDERLETPWISDIFAEAEKQFAIHPDASEACKNEFNLYKLHLKNNSLWAVRMAESSQWPKYGLLVGTKPFLGYFDECTAINAYGITGQQCLIESEYHVDETVSTPFDYSLDTLGDENSAWLALQLYKYDMSRIDRNKLQWTLCTPSSCSNSDLVESLRRTFNVTFGKYSINVTTNVPKEWCHTIETEEDVMYYYVKYFFYSLVAISIIFSLLLAKPTNKQLGHRHQMFFKVMECFSIRRNYHALVDVVPEREYMFIHGAKVLFSIAMLFFHSFFFKVRSSHHDASATEQSFAPRYPSMFKLGCQTPPTQVTYQLYHELVVLMRID